MASRGVGGIRREEGGVDEDEYERESEREHSDETSLYVTRPLQKTLSAIPLRLKAHTVAIDGCSEDSRNE